MKTNLIVIAILCSSILSVIAQDKKQESIKPTFFNRSEISYTFGIDEAIPNTTINALHIKTTFGFTLPHVGIGLGIETATFRGNNNANFNTLAFSGNLHLMAKPNSFEGTNYFLKGAAGYGVRIFNNYDRGLNYEAATGVIITTRKRSRYFAQAIYHHQNIDDFILSTGKIKIRTFGIGVGTWF
jgi:hypothetical protein